MKGSSEAVRVLVVEDEPVIRRVCLQTLSIEGFKVDIAADGSLAQGMLKKENTTWFLLI